MADRKASVSLELKASQFKAEADSVVGKVDKVDRAVDKLDRDITKIPPDAAKAGAAMRLLGADARSAGNSITNIGDKSTALTVLDSRIKKSRDEVKKLAAEFEKTGDIDVFRRLTKASGDTRVLGTLRKKLVKELEEGGREGGQAFASTFTQLFQGGAIKALMNPIGATLAGAIAIPLFSIIGSAIGGAVLAAGATGAVALGVAGAAQADPKRIGDAYKAEIARIKADWIDASKAFVGPTETAIHRLGGAVHDMDLDGILGRAAGYVPELTDGLSGLATHIGRAIKILVDNAGPVVSMLRDELPDIGAAIESFATDVSGQSKSAADGLRDVLDFAEGAIIAFGKMIAAAELMYHWFDQMRSGIADFIDYLRDTNGLLFVTLGIADHLSDLFRNDDPKAYGTKLHAAADNAKELSTAAEDTAAGIKSINDAFSGLGQSVEATLTGKILDRMFAIDDATISWQESLAKLDDTAKKNGTSLDVLNEKTGKFNDKALDNQKVLIAAAKANAEVYQQNLLSGMSAEKASQQYDMGSATLRKQAIAAGYNAKEVDNLIGKYKNVPAQVKTILAVEGLTGAINHLAQIIIDMRSLDGKSFASKYSITYTTYFKTVGRPYVQNSGNSVPRVGAYAEGGIRHAATGMIIGPSSPGTLIGEPQTGGEALIPLRGISQSRAIGLAQTVGNNYGFDVSARGGGRQATSVAVELRASGPARGLFAVIQEGIRTGALQVVAAAR